MTSTGTGIRTQLLLTLLLVTSAGFGLMYFISGSLVHNMFKEDQLERDQAIGLHLARELATDSADAAVLNKRLVRWQEAAGNTCIGLVRGHDVIGDPDRQRLERCLEGEVLQYAIETHTPEMAYEVVPMNNQSMLIVWSPLPAGPGQQTLGERSRLIMVSSLASVEARIDQTRRMLLLFMCLTLLLICLASYGLLTGMIVRPVSSMLRMIERVTGGDFEARGATGGGRELRQLGETLNRMTKALQGERLKTSAHITELKLINRELEQTQNRLIRSEKLASVGRLSAGIAHEIGNPIGIVLGYLEILQRPELLDSEREQYIAQALDATKRISVIIRDLLEFSRLEKSTDTQGPCDVLTVIQQTIQLLEPQSRFQHVKTKVVDRGAQFSVLMSEGRLQQVLVNILLNSADAMANQSEEALIDIELARQDGMVVLVISDTGPGLSSDIAETVFEPFVSTKESGAGTGLGLSVCESIVDMCGGTIRFVPSLGTRGAVVYIELPDALSDEQSSKPSAD